MQIEYLGHHMDGEKTTTADFLLAHLKHKKRGGVEIQKAVTVAAVASH